MQPTRRDYQWDQLSAKFRAYSRSRNALCHICIGRGDAEHAVIDYGAPRMAPLAYETDHLKPWTRYPHLRYSWANLAAAHSRCNRQRRDEMAEGGEHVDTVWVKPDW